MSLLGFQSALGRLIRVAPPGGDPLGGLDLTQDERARLDLLTQDAGFGFTVDVQRSWCVGRAAKAARLTLSMLPGPDRDRLLDEWVSGGGGTTSFFAAEADAFLDFLAVHLTDPHALTLCRVEQATLRASEGARRFAAPPLSWLIATAGAVRRGRHAMLVPRHAESRVWLAALTGEPIPPLANDVIPILFAPGLPGLFRSATDAESALWDQLTSPVALSILLQDADAGRVIETMALVGAVEHFDVPTQ